jgi:hypothetical protein
VTTKDFLLHTKFILVEWDHGSSRKNKSQLMLGYGSANLTSSGWSKNCEIWHWTEEYSELSTCRLFLEHLCKKEAGLAPFCSSWLADLPKSAKGLGWLFGLKQNTRKDAFDSLVQSCQGDPAVLRIVSPYWDKDSLSLYSTLLGSFASNRPHRIELWVDESRRLARRSDYCAVLDLFDDWVKTQPIVIKTVRVAERSAPAYSVVPLHAKMIEIEGSKGKATRIFGSANFTGQAWLKSYNLETIGIIKNAAPFPTLLQKNRPHLKEYTLTRNAVTKLIDASDPNEESENGEDTRPWINWATLDERDAQRIVSVSYQSKQPLSAISFEADFYPARLLNRKTCNDLLLRQIQSAYSAQNNWRTIHQEPTLLSLEYVGPPLQLPEKLTLRLEFADGLFAKAGVEIYQPDFEGQRDTDTGIPLLADLEGVLVGRKPIVPPIPKISVEESPDDSGDEEEELSAVPELDETLASIPDYDRLPTVERVIQIYHRAKQTDLQELNRLRARATKLYNQMTNKAAKLAIRALIQALKEN